MLPADSQNWQWLEREFLNLTALYGYREIRTPVFEDIELFTRTSGETSDIVTKQMYDFHDKGDRHITLKPEGTAPVIRAVLEHNLCPQGSVCRLTYITPIYRYERPQKGRLREAHQVGLELIGSPSVAADAEVIEITVRYYERLGLKDLTVLINSLGRAECRKNYRAALLAHVESWLKEQPEEFQVKVQKNPLRLLDSKDPGLQAVLADAPSILDFLEDDSKKRFEELQGLLGEVNVSFTVSPNMVRGLDYYTETVFEVQSTKLGAQSSLCGGGRYDDLVKELGGPPTPSVGVAMGLERALIVLEEEGLLRPQAKADVYIAYTGGDTQAEAMKLAREMRECGLAALIDIDGKSLKSQLKQADRSGVKAVVVLGEDEIKSGTVSLRDMQSSEQRSVQRSAIISTLKGLC